MSLDARFLFDAEYVLESMRRHRMQSSGRHILPGVKILASFVFMILGLMLIAGGKGGVGLLMFAPVAVLAFAPKLDTLAIRQRLRTSPFYGRTLCYTFSDDRVAVAQEIAETTMQWSAFTRLVIFNDGLLAYQGEIVYTWLAESAFSSREAFEEARNLFRAKIAVTKFV